MWDGILNSVAHIGWADIIRICIMLYGAHLKISTVEFVLIKSIQGTKTWSLKTNFLYDNII